MHVFVWSFNLVFQQDPFSFVYLMCVCVCVFLCAIQFAILGSISYTLNAGFNRQIMVFNFYTVSYNIFGIFITSVGI